MNHPDALVHTPTLADGDGQPVPADAAGEPQRVLVAAGGALAAAAGGVLRRCGCRVDAVADGEAAVAAAAACPYALMLIEPVLVESILVESARPAPAVQALARRIRALPHPHGDAPLLALASPLGIQDPDGAFAAGLDGVLDLAGVDPDPTLVLAHWLAAAADPNWGLNTHPDLGLPLLNRWALAQLEEDLGCALLPEVLETYFQETARRLGLLEAQVAAADAGAAADQAHALKGSAGTFGALALRQAVQALEQAGRAGETLRLAALLPKIRRLSALTDAALREHYASCPGGAGDA